MCDRVLSQVDRNVAVVVALCYIKISLLRQTSKIFGGKMDFQLKPEEEALRKEIKEFLEQELTPEVVEEYTMDLGSGPHTRDFMRKLGEKRYLAPSWPVEYGGMGASLIQRFVIYEEISYACGPGYRPPRAPLGVGMVGPTLLLFGSEEQKKEFLPRLASGEIEFALGYTEPNAGSDLAALEIKAEEDGGEWVINGQKLFSTSSHYAEYHWLAARTDFTVPKHKGISLFMIDLKTPGISIVPIYHLGGGRTNRVYYDNVRVPKNCLVGEKNRGWVYIGKALDFERLFASGHVRRVLEDLVEYCRTANNGGQLTADNHIIKHKLAELAVEVEVCSLLCYRVACMLDRGIVATYESSMCKLYGTELEQKLARTGMEILGLYSQLQKGSKWVRLNGSIEHLYRDSIRATIGGGTSEVQRNIIALRALGLPRG
jgi:hypothetical protein